MNRHLVFYDIYLNNKDFIDLANYSYIQSYLPKLEKMYNDFLKFIKIELGSDSFKVFLRKFVPSDKIVNEAIKIRIDYRKKCATNAIEGAERWAKRAVETANFLYVPIEEDIKKEFIETFPDVNLEDMKTELISDNEFEEQMNCDSIVIDKIRELYKQDKNKVYKAIRRSLFQGILHKDFESAYVHLCYHEGIEPDKDILEELFNIFSKYEVFSLKIAILLRDREKLAVILRELNEHYKQSKENNSDLSYHQFEIMR